MFEEEPKHDWDPLCHLLFEYKGLIDGFPSVISATKVCKEGLFVLSFFFFFSQILLLLFCFLLFSSCIFPFIDDYFPLIIFYLFILSHSLSVILCAVMKKKINYRKFN